MRTLIFAGLLLLSTQGIAQDNFNCFTVLAGKYATDDESVMLAHNEDDGGEQTVNLYKVPRVESKDSIEVRMKNGGILRLSPTTFAMIWLEMPGMEFSDSYQNEYGVTIVSDGCRSKEDQAILTDGGIGYWLRRAIALQAKTAREAVKIGGKLIEKYGYASSGRTYSIADNNEAWMLAAVNGKHWVAQRVPDDQVAVIPNYYTIGKIDLKDTLNFYGSKDLIDYARKRHWYKGDDDNFNFRLAYGAQSSLEHPVNIERHFDAVNRLSDTKYAITDTLSFSFFAKDLIKLPDLFGVLRSHFEGTELDKSNNYALGSPHKTHRAICAQSTQYGFVAQLRNYVPNQLNPIWISFVHPCTHTFVPLYNGITGFSNDLHNFTDYQSALQHHFDKFKRNKKHFFTTFLKDAEKVEKDYLNRIKKRKSAILKQEKTLLINQKKTEQKLFDKYKINNGILGEELMNYFNYLIHQQLN